MARLRPVVLQESKSEALVATLAERRSTSAATPTWCWKQRSLGTTGSQNDCASMRGYGAMISVDGDATRADAICECLRIVRHATSLGSVESTIERRAAVPGQQHLPSTLLRLSVGCENVEDLWPDFDSALGA